MALAPGSVHWMCCVTSLITRTSAEGNQACTGGLMTCQLASLPVALSLPAARAWHEGLAVRLSEEHAVCNLH